MNATITALAKKTSHDDEYVKLIQALHDEVEDLCKTRTDGRGGIDTTLYDWLYEGDYDGTETPESIAEEWDDLDEDYAMMKATRQAAALLGRKGGSVKSAAKSAASRENGRKGGRPKKVTFVT